MPAAMIACLDVDYRSDGSAKAAAVIFAGWGDAAAQAEYAVMIPAVAPYEPGHFYRRELPCLQAVLATVSPMPDVIMVDGYVYLDADGKLGLGGHLFEALHRKIPIIGVAKTAFASASAIPVTRGGSARPLFITAAGTDPRDAARHVGAMHGAHRIPTLLKRVDQVCRAT